MKMLFAILLLCSLSAQAGTLNYTDVKSLMQQISVRIEVNPDNGKQFILYKVNALFSAGSTLVLYCGAREILDPPGTWENMTGTLWSVFSLSFTLPNTRYANLGDLNWCTQ